MRSNRKKYILGALALTVATSVCYVLYSFINADQKIEEDKDQDDNDEELSLPSTRDEIKLVDIDDTIIESEIEDEDDLDIESSTVMNTLRVQDDTEAGSTSEFYTNSSVLPSSLATKFIQDPSVHDINEESCIQVNEDKGEQTNEPEVASDLQSKSQSQQEAKDTESESTETTDVIENATFSKFGDSKGKASKSSKKNKKK